MDHREKRGLEGNPPPQEDGPGLPSFTYLERRQTFFEEALFANVPVRSAELLLRWALPANELLDLAVTHELGHAICQDPSEVHADRNGGLQREGSDPTCATLGLRGLAKILTQQRQVQPLCALICIEGCLADTSAASQISRRTRRLLALRQSPAAQW